MKVHDCNHSSLEAVQDGGMFLCLGGLYSFSHESVNPFPCMLPITAFTPSKLLPMVTSTQSRATALPFEHVNTPGLWLLEQIAARLTVLC